MTSIAHLAALLLAASAAPASAQTTSEFTVDVGVLSDQLGVAVGGGVDHEVTAGGWLAAEGSLAGRAPVPYVAIDGGAWPLAGLGTLAGGWRLPLGERARIGPVAHVDLAVLASRERDCNPGDGCRHWWWLGSPDRGGLGVAFSPAGGLGWRVDGPSGARSDLALSIQPMFKYDVRALWWPRIDYGWTASSGWGFDVRLWRFGATIGLTRAL